MIETGLVNISPGEVAKVEGMNGALSGQEKWREDVYAIIGTIPVGTEGTFEYFRTRIAPYTGEPRHPNAWGAICNSLIKNGLLAPTARPHEATTTESNHACKRQILRRS